MWYRRATAGASLGYWALGSIASYIGVVCQCSLSTSVIGGSLRSREHRFQTVDHMLLSAD